MDGFAGLFTLKLNGRSHRCHCCRSTTLRERGAYEVCPVCLWEDDGRDEGRPGEEAHGAYGYLTLAEAQLNFERYGVCDPGLSHLGRDALAHEL